MDNFINNFIDFNRGEVENLYQEENLLAILKSSTLSKSITSLNNIDKKVKYFVNYKNQLKEALLIYLLYTKFSIKNNPKLDKSSFSNDLLIDNIKDIFCLGRGSLDNFIEGLTYSDVFWCLEVLPSFYTLPILSVNEATKNLSLFGEDTIPQSLLDFLKNNINSDSFDFKNATEELELFFEETMIDICNTPKYKYVSNSLSDSQIDFLVKHNGSYLYKWSVCKIYSDKLDIFLQKNLNNKSKMDKLFAILREIIITSACNIETVSNFIIKKDNSKFFPNFSLECLIFENMYITPDLIYINWNDFKNYSKLVLDIEALLSDNSCIL